jgi:putative ABC transport system substrate-binding protein
MHHRRKLIIVMGAGALTMPLGLLAQKQDKVWRIGYLSPASRPSTLGSDVRIAALLRGLRDLGYVEGKNLKIEWCHADDSAVRLQGYADELAEKKVDAIVTENTTATHAARKATATIPIIMTSSGDPVREGFAKSLAHPGGNVTGLTSLGGDLITKHLEMLFSMVPKLTRVAVLLNPANSGNLVLLKNVQTAARSTNAKILPVEVRTASEIEKAFSEMARENAGAVIVARDSTFIPIARQIAALALKYRLPSISGNRQFAEAGALMVYGPSDGDMNQRAATYMDKIFRGAKPGDLPVEQPTRFELIINGKTAKALGLKIPQSLLISADKVIE